MDVVGEDVDWEATLKQAAMSGGAVLIGGGVAQGVTAIMKGSSSVAQFAAMLGSDVITDATLEFLTTKQITWQGMVFTVLLSTIGNAVQLKQMKDAVDPAKITQKHSFEDLERQLVDIDAKISMSQSVDDIANLSSQYKLCQEAIEMKKVNEGLRMLSEDGVNIEFQSAQYRAHDQHDSWMVNGNANVKLNSNKTLSYAHYFDSPMDLQTTIAKEYYNFKRHNMVSFTGLGGKRGRTGSYD